MQFFVSAHAKVAVEFLYLETGAKPVKFVIKSRRLNYLKEIHNRENHELIKRIYESQKKNPSKGDWTEIVKDDLETIEVNENELKEMSKGEAKQMIKSQIEKATFKYLQDTKKTHEKVKYIVYTKLETQPYLKTSIITNKEAEILTALRSQTVRGIKNNFHSFYENDQQCPLCKSAQDTQEHCMVCPKIVEKMDTVSKHMKYEHIFGSLLEQKEVAHTYLQIINIRKGIM